MIYVACLGPDFVEGVLLWGEEGFHNVRVRFSLPLYVTLSLSLRLRRKCRNGRRQKSLCCWRRLRKRAQVRRFRTSILNYPPCSSISHPVAHSQATWPSIGHRKVPMCSWSTSKRSINNNPFTVHANIVDPYSPNRPGVITDLFSSSQT